MSLKFQNNLNIPVEIYFLYEKEGNEMYRGAGLATGDGDDTHLVSENGGILSLDISDLPNTFQLHIKLKELPTKDGVKGIDVYHGKYIGESNDTKLYQMDDHVLYVINYTTNDELIHSHKDMTHVDPTTRHPPVTAVND